MKKVLVVDDDFDTRNIWRTALQHHGYSVICADDGAEAIRQAVAEAPDVILMNVSMPRLDGITTTARLREDPRTTDIPVIACTGYVAEDGRDDAELAGCVAYLEKPCEPSRLVEEVQRFIGPPIPAGGTGLP
jgi:two-component system, cell cycle response regulator DivK